jgi:hypothetical protein
MTIWIYGPHQTLPFSGLALRTSQQRFIKDDILCKGHNPWDFNIYGMTETNAEWHLASDHKNYTSAHANGGILLASATVITALTTLLTEPNMVAQLSLASTKPLTG